MLIYYKIKCLLSKCMFLDLTPYYQRNTYTTNYPSCCVCFSRRPRFPRTAVGELRAPAATGQRSSYIHFVEKLDEGRGGVPVRLGVRHDGPDEAHVRRRGMVRRRAVVRPAHRWVSRSYRSDVYITNYDRESHDIVVRRCHWNVVRSNR